MPQRPPCLPASQFPRDAGQRAAFGRFAMNLSGGAWPERVLQIATQDFQFTYFRRALFGRPGPMLCVLAERRPAAPAQDLTQIAAAVLDDVPGSATVPIIKIFVATNEGVCAAPLDYRAAFVAEEDPDVIELDTDFESFLGTLGKHTRRQIRQLQRKAVKFGYRFAFGRVEMRNLDARTALGRHAGPERFSAGQIAAYERFLAAQHGNYAASLHSDRGALLSYSSGLISDGAAILRYQMNDRRLAKASLSLSLRGHLLDALIAAGIRELIIPGGVAGVLQHACRHRGGGELILIRDSAAAAFWTAAAKWLRPESSVAMALGRVTA